MTVDVCDHRVAGSIPAAETLPDPLCSNSNPLLSEASLAQSVERKALNLVVVGSSPTGGAVCRGICRGGVAQMVERSLSMREVQGSIPCISTFHKDGEGGVRTHAPEETTT